MKTKKLQLLWAMLITMAFSLIPLQAEATHYRYGTINWQSVSGNTVQFKVDMAYRRTFFNVSTLGQTVNVGRLYFGDGTWGNIALTVTSINVAEDWFFGTATISKTYANSGNHLAYWTLCCRISPSSGMVNNTDQVARLETVVNVGSGNSSPVTNLPPMVNVATGLSGATFNVPSNDPDGDAVTYRLATPSEVSTSNNFVQPSGFSISSNGIATISTIGKNPGQLYSAAIVVEDGQTKTIVDFLIKVTIQSTPPAFDYSLTPPDNFIYQVAPGQNVNFSVRATDSDPGDIVSLQAVGLPTGVSMNPALPVSGNPVLSNFSWTPTNAHLGSHVFSFIAQDLNGVQKTSSITIQVSLKPVFNVPPTPANGSVFQYEPGMNISFNFQASDPDPNDLVQIVSALGMPSGASLSNPLPTNAGNPTSTSLSWTPALSNWGLHSITFKARDTYNDETNHNVKLIVNSQPSFTSTPVVSAMTGQPYSYNITATDPDMPFGDQLDIITAHGSLPAWLTLVDHGNGTATLSGIPTAAGMFHVGLHVEDIYHHGYANPPVATAQHFDIMVIDCTMPAFTSCPSNMNVGTSTNSCDAIVNYSVTASGTPNPTINYVFSGATSGFGNGTGSGETFNLGVTTVNITATNSCGSTTCSFTVNVADNTAPTTLANNVTVQLDAAGNGSITVAQINNGSSDACGIATLTLDNMNFTCTNVGANTVTLTATDVNGNSSSATATITIKDEVAPIVLTNNVTLQLDAAGNGSITVAQINNGSSDACGIATLVLDNMNFDCSNVGVNTVTLTATDVNGNSSSATATVTVEDNIAPSLIVPADVTMDGYCMAIPVTIGNAVTADNCGVASVVNDAPALFAVGTTIVTWTVTDVNGNSTSATQQIDVVPGIVTVDAGNDVNTYYGYAPMECATLTGSATGGTGIYSYSWNTGSTTTSTTECPTGPTTYTFTVTDNHQCVGSDMVTVNALDVRCGNKMNKVEYCHKGKNTICISPNAVPAHI
ncbi:MAG: hypothetical protein H0X62_07935, partial [Bacteroidetes bacterium]|nr:hypothetical protein [Bacteroidota bacterium]